MIPCVLTHCTHPVEFTIHTLAITVGSGIQDRKEKKIVQHNNRFPDTRYTSAPGDHIFSNFQGCSRRKTKNTQKYAKIRKRPSSILTQIIIDTENSNSTTPSFLSLASAPLQLTSFMASHRYKVKNHTRENNTIGTSSDMPAPNHHHHHPTKPCGQLPP